MTNLLRGRRHKFGAVATVVDNIRFASKLEAIRYADLKLLVRCGEIRNLELQPRFDLSVLRLGRFHILGRYVADFRYRKGPTGILVIEDVKGFDVPLQRWKRKHAEAQYGITVTLYPPRAKKARQRNGVTQAKRAPSPRRSAAL